jgi:molecular chaperone HscC
MPAADGSLPEGAAALVIERGELESWAAPVLGRTEAPLRRALRDAGLSRNELAEVILVGGATRMPAVVERVTAWFGRPPQSRLHPEEVVAMGASVQAALFANDHQVSDPVVTDLAPFSLGIESTHTIGGGHFNGYFAPIIHRNTTIPVSRVERFSTVDPYQTMIKARIFQGGAAASVTTFSWVSSRSRGFHGPFSPSPWISALRTT